LFVSWYSYLSVFRHIPNYKASITLIQGTPNTLDNLYVIDDYNQDTIGVIDNNIQITIPKSSIVKINTEFPTTPQVTLFDRLCEYVSDFLK
jgi:hypothetical protein